MAGRCCASARASPTLVAMAAFLAVGMLRWPIYWVLGVLIPCGIALAWWLRR